MPLWKDPHFGPHLTAFDEVRVIEIPTDHWTAYDAKKLNQKPLEGSPISLQERVYASTNWHTPRI